MAPTTQPNKSIAPVRCPQCHKIIVERLTNGQLYATCPRCKTAMVADTSTMTVERTVA
jgi:phage FluMu protein Com